jgi:hypothetical protein
MANSKWEDQEAFRVFRDHPALRPFRAMALERKITVEEKIMGKVRAQDYQPLANLSGQLQVLEEMLGLMEDDDDARE